MAMQNADYIALLADMPSLSGRHEHPGLEVSQQEGILRNDESGVLTAGLVIEDGGTSTKVCHFTTALQLCQKLRR